MPNHWARSQRFQCQHGHKLVNYQFQPLGTISKASMSTRTQARKLLIPNHLARSQRFQCQHGHTIDAKPIGPISSARSFNRGTNYSLTESVLT